MSTSSNPRPAVFPSIYAFPDERSAASTGAGTERHRSNDLNPTSAPALSLPIQRLGSAMEGLTELKQLLCDIGMSLADREYVANRWASEVEALRQRPGPHVQQYLWLEERRDYAVRELKIAKDESTRQIRLQDIDTFDRAMRDLGDEVAAKAALRQRPGAQAPSTAALPTWDESRRVCNLPDVDEAIRNLLDDPTEDNATCLVRAVLAAPSTGGAETAPAQVETAFASRSAGGLSWTGYWPQIVIGGVELRGQERPDRAAAETEAAAIRTVLASSAPASSTGGAETAERKLRFMLCSVFAGALGYYDDGEAQDSRAAPHIDFMRDSVDEIQRKIWARNRASFAASPASKEDGAQLGSGAGAQSDSGADSGHATSAVPYLHPSVSEASRPVHSSIHWPEGYCCDPNGKICAPAGKYEDFSFGYDLGYADGLMALTAAVAALATVEAKEKTR